MFTASHPFPFFDYFRVPHAVAPGAADLPRGVGRLTPTGPGDPRPSLYWWRDGAAPWQPWRVRTGRFTLAGFTLVCPVLRDLPAGLGRPAGTDSGWSRVEPILGADGQPVAWVHGDAEGNVFLPFDPAEAMEYLWSERYNRLGLSRWSGAARRTAVQGYYALRPLLPRAIQIRLRQGYAARVDLPDFPRWPAEHCLHDFYDWLWDVLAGVAGGPVPHLSLWPDGKQAAFVLTHDVETAVGRDAIEDLRTPERTRGLRSAWNFVPERYEIPAALVASLRDEGCEIGVHGLRHDGHDLSSRRQLRRRLPAIRAAADRWGAAGFRSPATQRRWKLMPTTGFDYDSTYCDTAPHEPEPGGSCTYLPFFNQHQVELPMTLPMDHTLFEILGHADGTVWRHKAAELVARSGMVLVLTHPDYTQSPGLVEAYGELLDQLGGDEAIWQALPVEVSTWWRDRAASTMVRDADADADGWRVSGPASARGQVAWGGRASTEQPLGPPASTGEKGTARVDQHVAG